MQIDRLLPLLLALTLSACATWQAPDPVDPGEFRQRAAVAERQGVTVRALVLDRDYGQRLLGADVFALNIEPVWLEISNGSGQPLTLLQSGADPDYYSPLEVSWSLHSTFGGSNNEAIDRHLQAVAYPRGPMLPGETRSGVIFTNPHHNVKFLNVDMFGENRFIPFAFFLPIPAADGTLDEPQPWRYDADEMTDYGDEQTFSEALRSWFARELMEPSSRMTQPVTMVWVGRPRDIGAALVRRGYRWGPMEDDLEQRLQGRPPDHVLHKSGQAGVPANWIRLWALSMSFQQRPVLVAQTGAPLGGRFAPDDGKREFEPALDSVRDLVVQDMLYSGATAKLAVMQRPSVPERFRPLTDGRVAILFVAARPLGLSDIYMSNWETTDWKQESEPYGPRIRERE